MSDPQPLAPRSRLEAATALVYSEVSTLLDRLEDLHEHLTRVDAGIASTTASLKEETDRRAMLLNESIGAMRLTTDREKEGLAVFIEQRASQFVALAANGQLASMKTAARDAFQREVECSVDKLVAAVARSRLNDSASSPMVRLMALMGVGLLGGCAGALMTLLIVDYVRGVA